MDNNAPGFRYHDAMDGSHRWVSNNKTPPAPRGHGEKEIKRCPPKRYSSIFSILKYTGRVPSVQQAMIWLPF